MNLRFYQKGATKKEQQVEALGLAYENMPVNPAELTEEYIDYLIERIHALLKPLLVYGDSSLRATNVLVQP